MNLITTTELRTKTSKLVESLLRGEEVDLIHRSKIVATIKPKEMQKTKRIDSKKLQEKIDKLNLPSLTLKETDRRYRIAMMQKHGQGLR